MLATIGGGARRPISRNRSTDGGASTKLASGPGRARGRHAGDGLVDAYRRQRVGPGDDEEVARAARLDRGANLVHVLLAFHDALAAHVAALLGPHLILQEAAGGLRRQSTP